MARYALSSVLLDGELFGNALKASTTRQPLRRVKNGAGANAVTRFRKSSQDFQATPDAEQGKPRTITVGDILAVFLRQDGLRAGRLEDVVSPKR